ncbi:MAG: nicotinamide-nucleotide amidohydrolase family protein [Clostridia bacterium]|nr:nicotinamide-nucleotide amidohydrolase family protein [Clostridia bacterium]
MKTEEKLKQLLSDKGLTISSAESCTGGLIAKRITDIPGSSSIFLGSLVTYTNEMKCKLLGVSPETIRTHTEVSFECATEMAERVRLLTGADIGLSTTGFAGPGGGTQDNPVGTIYVGVSTKDVRYSVRLSLPPELSRSAMRSKAAGTALTLALREAKKL